MSRVAAIGIDAGEWHVFTELADSGRMPNLARLRAASVELSLVNDVVGKPEEAWAGFLYGDDHKRAGHWSNLTFDPATYRSYRQGAFSGPPFFSASVRRSVVFDVPKSTVRPDAAATQVTAWGAHAPSFPRASNPAGLLRDLDRRFGPHQAWGNDYENCWYQPDFIDGLADQLVCGARVRADATTWLLEQAPDWDLFLTVFSETHSGGHHLWHGVDPRHPLAASPTAGLAGRRMTDIHEAVDGALGRIVASLPPETVTVVFSVHGMQPNDSDVAAFLLLPELLHRFDGRRPRLVGPDQRAWARRGFPRVIPDPRRRPLAFAHDHLDVDGRRRLRRSLTSGPLLSLERAWRDVRGMPPGNRRRWRAAEDVPGEVDLTALDPTGREEGATEYPNLWYRDAWPTMRAFALPSFGEGRIRVNLEGRERDGFVSLDDYERTCAALERVVRETVDPRTGASVATDVVWARLHDPLDPLAPDADLLVTWAPGIDAFDHPDLGPIGPFPLLRMSEHSNAGFALVSGPTIERTIGGTRSTNALQRVILELLGGNEVVGGEAVLRAADVA